MTKTARWMVAAAAVLMAGMLVLPLWRIDLIAPQYPEGLGMLIRVNTVTGLNPHDLDNINALNHYIGMKPILPDAIPELRYMPWIVGGLVAFGLLAAALGRRRVVMAWIGATVALALVGLADFWRWGYDYGHNLDSEHAIIKIPGMAYQPPLIGTKQLLNFTATSWPDAGAVVAGIALAIAVAALVIDARGGRTRPAARPRPVAGPLGEPIGARG